MRKLLLFDIDGTLVDVGSSGRAALGVAMLQVFGDTGPIDGYDFHGRTDPAIVRGLLRESGRTDEWIDARVPELWPVYFSRLEQELLARRSRVRVLAGVVELLQALSAKPLERRYCVALLTGNMEIGAWAKLRACNLDTFFSFGAFGSDSEFRGELPDVARARAEEYAGRPFPPDSAVVIGDTPYDIQCARAGGARMVAVATGRHSARELEESGAELVLEDLTDTTQVLRLLEGD